MSIQKRLLEKFKKVKEDKEIYPDGFYAVAVDEDNGEILQTEGPFDSELEVLEVGESILDIEYYIDMGRNVHFNVMSSSELENYYN